MNHDYRQLMTHIGQWRGDPDSLSDRLLVGLSEVRHLRHADEAVSLIKSTSRIDPGWLSSWTKETEQMHWIPQQFHTQLKKLFPEISADALGFTEAIEKGFHKFVHGKGADGTRHLAYNGQVQQWLDLALQNGRVPTLEEFYQFIGELRDEYLKLYEDYLRQMSTERL